VDWQAVQIMKNIEYHRTMMLQAEIRMQTMIAENKQREVLGHSMAYVEKDFIALIDEFGVHHNAVLTNLQNGL